MNWALVIPRGDWLESYPTTNGRIIQGLRLAFLFVAFVLLLIIVILVVAFYGPADKLEKVPWGVIEGFLQLLGWMIFGLIGVAAAQFVGKRATADPKTIKAISDAKIAEAQTGTFPVQVLTEADAKEAAEALEARQREITAASADGAVG